MFVAKFGSVIESADKLPLVGSVMSAKDSFSADVLI